MRFTLDEKQQAIADLAAEVLDDTGPEQAWKALAGAGLLALAVPERLGGDGLGAVEVAVLLGEIGRRALAVPALATLAFGVLPVVRWGSAEQQDEVLSGVASGTVLTAAVREPVSAVSDGTVVRGTAVGVPYAERAHRILVPVDLAGGGSGVALVDPRRASVTRTPAAGAMPEYTVSFVDTPVAGMLSPGADVFRYAVAGTCALGAGALAGALALTAAHVGGREQFGRPLATFQAVAQQIADVYVAARTVRLAALAACWGLSDDDLAVAAYWFATEAPVAVRTCHHLHGGLGLDVTYPLHRYSSLIRDLVRSLGGAEYRLEKLCSST
ncbi:acyl-CoA dehydrogenase family protein [Virgisporangium aurantiacum]|uniref:Acyl-CoA dehydrogenase n=1 Tax=Virgisporangium aurantiacum TaxID=175570 RepID=A0A8J3ZFK2_9ACTN|nr:acyl-CoA dehydrogenase family protein [Virgisporangium aurantiacum]GIJ60666.1 acyl-CoA dehydrogenase [Virgisporangium aurantiacum]